MSNMVVTGAGGLVGSALVRRLLSAGHVVHAVDSFRYSQRGDLHRLSGLENYVKSGYLKIVRVDLSLEIGPRVQAFFPNDVEAVFNCASDSHVDRAISDPATCWQNNTSLMLNVLEWMREMRPSVFLHLSSDEVYGDVPRGGEDHGEWSTIRPSNPYSASKAAQEALCFSYWRTFGVPLILVNAANIIGERQDVEKFVPRCISKIFSGETIQIHVDHSGNPLSRLWLDVENLVSAMTFISTFPVTRYTGWDTPVPDRYHVSGPDELDVKSMALLLAEVANRKLNLVEVPGDVSRPGYDARYALSWDKLRRVGFVPTFDLRKTVERLVAFSAANPEWLS